jgi:hypothetical protein
MASRPGKEITIRLWAVPALAIIVCAIACLTIISTSKVAAPAATATTSAVPFTRAALGGLEVTSSTTTTITLRWAKNVPGGRGIRVLRSTDDWTYTTIATLPPTSTSYVDGNLKPNSFVFYRIELLLASGVVNYRSMATDGATKALPIAGFAAKTIGTDRVQLNWIPGAPPLVDYDIERASDGEIVPYHFGQVANPEPTASTYIDHGVIDGTKYDYRIFAVNTAGLSPSSPIASTITELLPPTEAHGRVDPIGVQIWWSSESYSTRSFVVERLYGGFVYLPVAVVQHEFSYLDEDIRPETRYQYRIRGLNDLCISAPSNAFQIETPSRQAMDRTRE